MLGVGDALLYGLFDEPTEWIIEPLVASRR